MKSGGNINMPEIMEKQSLNSQEYKQLLGGIKKQRAKPRQYESKQQQACVKWFRLSYPHYSNMLISIPNEGKRSKANYSRMVSEGMIAGCADLILLVSNDIFPCLCLEGKFGKGKQSDAQKEWQKECEKAGNCYVLFDSTERFIQIITEYFRDKTK